MTYGFMSAPAFATYHAIVQGPWDLLHLDMIIAPEQRRDDTVIAFEIMKLVTRCPS